MIDGAANWAPFPNPPHQFWGALLTPSPPQVKTHAPHPPPSSEPLITPLCIIIVCNGTAEHAKSPVT